MPSLTTSDSVRLAVEGFSLLFVSFFLLTLGLRFWLAGRHIRHVARHRRLSQDRTERHDRSDRSSPKKP